MLSTIKKQAANRLGVEVATPRKVAVRQTVIPISVRDLPITLERPAGVELFIETSPRKIVLTFESRKVNNRRVTIDFNSPRTFKVTVTNLISLVDSTYKTVRDITLEYDEDGADSATDLINRAMREVKV